jgi:hypothetical protein
MFLSTRDFNGVYEFIIGACKKNCESLLKKKLALLVFKIKKFPSLHYLFFLFYILLSGRIIKRNRCEIKYKNIEIGKFIISFTYYDYECYVNKLKFYKLLIKNFLLAGSIINTCSDYYKKNNIKGIYIDHCGFINGVIFSFFSQKKLPVYTNNYPHGIYFVNYKTNKKKYLLKYENTLKINSKIKINKSQKKKAEKKISKLAKDKNFIPWLSETKFKALKKINYKDFDYVIYSQSFTDGQMYYGFDGFENNLEWLEFTLNKFIETKKKILIKPHPNYYNNKIAIYSLWDKKIYNLVIQKYKKYKNLYFLQQPIHNYTLLKKLNKNCITISKMGSVILENSYMNFKSISSAYTFFNQKFNISNMWKNREDYLKLLNKDGSELIRPKKDDLLTIIYTLFYTHYSNYNTNSWYLNIIKKNLKLSKRNFNKLFIAKARSKISNSKLIKINKFIYSKKDIITDKMSKKIYEVKI